jgi:hypothetical protein
MFRMNLTYIKIKVIGQPILTAALSPKLNVGQYNYSEANVVFNVALGRIALATNAVSAK